MISKHDLAKALSNKAREIATANSLTLVANNEQFTPDVNGTYIQQFTIFGDDNAKPSLSDSDSDAQIGVYQINVHTPKADLSAEWDGLKIIDAYQAGFYKGLELPYNGQMVRIKTGSVRNIEFFETHLTHVLSVEYLVIN